MKSTKHGLIAILFATAFAGALGYILQALVPVWLRDPSDYLQFSVFWATTFLLVSMLSGLQQEISRTVHPIESLPSETGRADRGKPGRLLFQVGATVALLVALLVPATALFWGESLFPNNAPALVGAMTLALIGYLMIALLSGKFYGLSRFGFAAATTITDAVFRTILVLVPLAIGLGLTPVAYGVALPFSFAAILIWAISRRRLNGRYYVDVGAGKLLRNGGQAMLAALATGVLISGLPTVLRLTSSGLSEQTLAALILALTLTRAPLVVPLLALQSYLVVGYRNSPSSAASRAIKLTLGLFAVTAVVAALVAWVGYDLLVALYGSTFALDGFTLAFVVVSGGATAALCIIAPALLAAGLHSRYLAGWAISAVATIVLLAIFGQSLTGTIAAIAIGPLSGCLLCLAMLRTRIPNPTNPQSAAPPASI